MKQYNFTLTAFNNEIGYNLNVCIYAKTIDEARSNLRDTLIAFGIPTSIDIDIVNETMTRFEM